MIPTGKKRRANGGGGSGGSIKGRTTIDAASAIRIKTEPKLKQRTILFWFLVSPSFLWRSCSAGGDEVCGCGEGKSVIVATVGNFCVREESEKGWRIWGSIYKKVVARDSLDWDSFDFRWKQVVLWAHCLWILFNYLITTIVLVNFIYLFLGWKGNLVYSYSV